MMPLTLAKALPTERTSGLLVPGLTSSAATQSSDRDVAQWLPAGSIGAAVSLEPMPWSWGSKYPLIVPFGNMASPRGNSSLDAKGASPAKVVPVNDAAAMDPLSTVGNQRFVRHPLFV